MLCRVVRVMGTRADNNWDIVCRTPFVDLERPHEEQRCTACGEIGEDVFALTLTLTDESGSLPAILYGESAVCAILLA